MFDIESVTTHFRSYMQLAIGTYASLDFHKRAMIGLDAMLKDSLGRQLVTLVFELSYGAASSAP